MRRANLDPPFPLPWYPSTPPHRKEFLWPTAGGVGVGRFRLHSSVRTPSDPQRGSADYKTFEDRGQVFSVHYAWVVRLEPSRTHPEPSRTLCNSSRRVRKGGSRFRDLYFLQLWKLPNIKPPLRCECPLGVVDFRYDHRVLARRPNPGPKKVGDCVGAPSLKFLGFYFLLNDFFNPFGGSLGSRFLLK
jgi:hypothetical protein